VNVKSLESVWLQWGPSAGFSLATAFREKSVVVVCAVVDGFVRVENDESAVEEDDGFVDAGVEVGEVDGDVFVVVLGEENVKDVKGVADDAVVGREVIEVDVVGGSGEVKDVEETRDKVVEKFAVLLLDIVDKVVGMGEVVVREVVPTAIGKVGSAVGSGLHISIVVQVAISSFVVAAVVLRTSSVVVGRGVAIVVTVEVWISCVFPWYKYNTCILQNVKVKLWSNINGAPNEKDVNIKVFCAACDFQLQSSKPRI
jgi:hypothetical protein